MRKLVARFALLATAGEWVTILAIGLRLGSGALLLPVLLYSLPAAEMGVWYVFLSVAAVGPIFDLGFSTTIARFASMYWAGVARIEDYGVGEHSVSSSPNFQGLAELWTASRLIYAAVAAALVLVMHVFGYYSVLNSGELLSTVAGGVWVWVLFVGASGVSVYMQFSNTLLRGVGKVALSQWLQIGACLLNLVVVSSLVLSGVGIVSLVAGMIVSAVTVGVLSRTALRRCGVIPSSYVNFEIIRKIIPHSWRMAMVAIGSYFIYNSCVLLSAKHLDAGTVASLGLTNQLAGVLESTAGAFIVSAAPKFSQLIVSNDKVGLRGLFWTTWRRGMTLYLAGSALILLLAPVLLQFISSRTNLLSPGMVGFILFYKLLEFNHCMFAGLVMATNKNPFAWAALCSGALIYSSGSIMVVHGGLWALLVVVFLVQLAVSNWYPVVLGLRVISGGPRLKP